MLELLGLVIITWALIYQRASHTLWVPAIGAALALILFYGSMSWLLYLPILVIYLMCVTLNYSANIRLTYIVQPLLSRMRKLLPPMTDTEKQAIEAGDVWWEGELFSGNPDWHNLHTISQPSLTEEEQNFLDNQVQTLCNMIDNWEINEKQRQIPKEILAYIKKEGFWGLVIPKEEGGLGFSALAHSTIILKVSSHNASVAVTIMVPNSLGPAELIHRYGTEKQKNYYLPRLAAGDEIPCFALTGPHAGSDAGAMLDEGCVCMGEHEGKQVLGIRLNWDKRYITLAPIATLLGIAFKLYDPEGLLGEESSLGITLALIPTHYPGVEIGKRHQPTTLIFMNGPTRGKDVFIPIDWIIGGQAMAGQGWRMLMECLSIGRAVSLPALGTATTLHACRTTSAYAAIRKQFRTPIGEFEGVAEALARITGFAYISEAARLMTAGAVDLNIQPAIASAINKYHLTELGRKAINDALDIHAGKGLQQGPSNYLWQAYEAIPMSITVEGANILTRNLIIFGQGAVRCHPYIQKEMALMQAEDNEETLHKFDAVLGQHISYTLCNAAKTFALGLTNGLLANSYKKGPLAHYYRQLTRMSAALAFNADIAMLILGGELKRRESLSARLGDVLSHLYLASAVLKNYQDQGSNTEELPLVKWSLDYCLNEIQTAFDGFFTNLPNRFVGRLLCFLVFPWGYSYHKPSDKRNQEVAAKVLKPSELRQKLTKYCYLSDHEDDSIVRLEQAFQKITDIHPIEEKLALAMKQGLLDRKATLEQTFRLAKENNILDDEELEKLIAAEQARLEIILVDEFEVNATGSK